MYVLLDNLKDLVAFRLIYSGSCGKHLVVLDIISQHDDPIGSGLGKEAVVEAAGPDCIVPGQTVPIKLLGLKVPPSPSAFSVQVKTFIDMKKEFISSLFILHAYVWPN